MNVTFTIGEKLPSAFQPNTYTVKVTYMHGDADGYTNHTYQYPPNKIEQLKLDLIGLNIPELDYGEGTDIDAVSAAYEAYGVDNPESAAEKFDDRFVEYDIQSEGSRAQRQKVEVLFYDENAIPHNVIWQVI